MNTFDSDVTIRTLGVIRDTLLRIEALLDNPARQLVPPPGTPGTPDWSDHQRGVGLWVALDTQESPVLVVEGAPTYTL